MILMGDEVRRTQFGNNNAYCQDNEISWFDWTLLSKHKICTGSWCSSTRNGLCEILSLTARA